MSLDKNLRKILIIDFGSQFTQLIARRIRESGVYSEIISHKKVKNKNIDNSIKGIILSGGPLNVYQINKYSFDRFINIFIIYFFMTYYFRKNTKLSYSSCYQLGKL